VNAEEEKQERTRQRVVIERAVRRIKNRGMSLAFNSFVDAVEISLQKRRLMQRVKTSWLQPILAGAFEAWAGYIEQLQVISETLNVSNRVRQLSSYLFIIAAIYLLLTHVWQLTSKCTGTAGRTQLCLNA